MFRPSILTSYWVFRVVVIIIAGSGCLEIVVDWICRRIWDHSKGGLGKVRLSCNSNGVCVYVFHSTCIIQIWINFFVRVCGLYAHVCLCNIHIHMYQYNNGVSGEVYIYHSNRVGVGVELGWVGLA